MANQMPTPLTVPKTAVRMRKNLEWLASCLSQSARAWLSAMIGAGSGQLSITFGLPGLVGVAAGSRAGYVALAIGAAIVVVTALLLRERLRARPELTVAVFVCLSLLLSPHVLAPDFVLLAPALSLSARWRRGPSVAASAVLSLAFLPALTLSSPNVLLGFVAIAAAALVAVMALAVRNATPNGAAPVAATLGATA